MAYTVSFGVRTSIVEIKSPTGADSGNPDVGFTSGNPSGDTYNSGTTVPVTVASKFTVTMSGGAATIDLTAIPDDVNGTADGTGLKVNFLRLENPSTNANKITISQGASAAYRLDGATNWSIVLAPGQKIQFEGDAAADAVGGSHKNIDLAGTLAQTLKVHVGLG